MARSVSTSIAARFRRVPDPRVRRTRRHPRVDILVITRRAVICGADDWVAIAHFGHAKRKWFRGFLTLRHGIPSHDTFGRVFAALDPEAFRTAFLAWVQTVAALLPGDVIAIDGKTLRHTFDTAGAKAAIHMVSAWAVAQGLCLGQIKTEAKSNEITAIPKLLEVLALAGRVVTIDAMGCQTAIARAIHAKGGDYVLSLKGNQTRLHDDIQHADVGISGIRSPCGDSSVGPTNPLTPTVGSWHSRPLSDTPRSATPTGIYRRLPN